MSFKIIKPSPQLAPYIRMYWAMENSLPKQQKHKQRIVPSGFGEITFYEGNIPDSTLKDGYLKSSSQISGQKNNHFDLIISGTIKLFSVVFEPYGISRFFNISASELFNQTIPLRFILGTQLDALEDKIFESKSLANKIVLIENFFSKLLSEDLNYSLPRILNSVQEISANNNLGVTHLASNANLSRKQYERNFANTVGISPKQFMRVIRFQRALYIRQNNLVVNLTQLAYDAGYYDQSHMVSEFKLLSGYSPKQYFDQCAPYSDYFTQI